MTTLTCANTETDLLVLRRITELLRGSQGQTEALAAERRRVVARLRADGVPLRVIGDAMGTGTSAAWALTQRERAA